jgi:hypothetical protein
MLDLMTVKPEGGDERVVSFGEFERFYQEIFLDKMRPEERSSPLPPTPSTASGPKTVPCSGEC